MPLTDARSWSSVRKWKQSTQAFSCVEVSQFSKGESLARVLSCKSHFRDFLKKNSHYWHHVSVAQGRTKFDNWCDISNLLMNSMSLKG